MADFPNISPDLIKAYEEEIKRRSSGATAKRKMSSLRRFFDWAEKKGHVEENPLKKEEPVQQMPSQIPQQAPEEHISTPAQNISKDIKGARSWFSLANGLRVGVLAALVVLVFLLTGRLELPIPSRKAPASQDPSVPDEPQQPTTLSAWNLYAKMTLKNQDETPATGTQTVTFKVYEDETNPDPLHTVPQKEVIADENGEILVNLADIPRDLFFENERLYLGAELNGQEMSSRLPLSTANYAANLLGFFPAQEAGPNTIPVLSADGSLLLAAEAPSISATSGNLLIEGNTLTLTTPDASDGNITLNPDGSGNINAIFEGTGGTQLDLLSPNLTTGTLIGGTVSNNAAGYNLIDLKSGSDPKSKFSVDAHGGTFIGGNLNVQGNIATNDTERLTSEGVLTNITGYSQEEGNFSITQEAGDTFSVNQNQKALSDPVSLNLDERGYQDTKYSTLVLRRYEGTSEAMALLVDQGNARFNGQLRLGRFDSNPDAIGTGSLIFNSSDNNVYVWSGSSWVSVGGSGTTIWTKTSGVIHSTTAADDLAIGGTDSTSPFFVNDSGTITFSTDTNLYRSVSNTLRTDDSFSVGSDLTAAGNLDVNGSTSDIAGTLNLSGNTLSSSGDLTIDPTGGGVKIGTGTPGTVDLAGDDLYVTQDLEVDGTIYGDGSGLTGVTVNSISFDNITSGTNTSAAMTVGSGSSLTYSGSGTINASTLDSLTASQFLRSDATDSYTSGTLTFDAGTTLDINGDLSVADTDIQFDGANTQFTTTGDLTLSPGGGDVILTDASTINIGGSGSEVAYNVIGDSIAGASNVDSDDDLYIEGNLEVDGTIYGNVSGTIDPGFTEGSVIFQGSSGLAEDNTNFFFDDTDNKFGLGTNLPDGKLQVEGSVTGKALTILNETGDQDILAASASGTTRARITNGGNLYITGTLNTISGNLTIDSAGGQTTVDDNFVVTGTSDLQGNISNSAGNLTLDDTVDITGNLDTAGTLTVGTADALFIDASGNITTSGDAAINGGDITTTSSTASLFNTNATTLNIGGAATTVEIGAASGTTSVNNSLTIDGNTTLGDTSGDTVTFTGQVNSNILPSADDTYDLGSATNRWQDLYVVNLNAGSTDISGTTSETFTIDTDDTGGDLSLVFGTTLNERLTWDATTDNRFEFSDALEVQGDLTSTGNLDVDGTSNDIAGTLNLSGDNLTSSGDLVINASGGDISTDDRTTIGTQTPGVGQLNVSGTQIGKALVILNDTGTDQNILTASASGTTVANLDRSGNLEIEGTISDISDTKLIVDDDLQINGSGNIFDSGGANRIQIGSTISLSGDVSVSQALSVNGNTTLGDSASDTITFNATVAQDSDLVPFTTTGTNDLGSSSNPWDNIYGVTGDFSGTITANDFSCTDCLDFTELADNLTLDAATDIALGSLTLSTSGTGAMDFNSTGQVSFAGNINAESGLDVTGSNLTVGGSNFSVDVSNGDITTSGDLAVNGGNITSTGDLDINPSGGDLTIQSRTTIGSGTPGVGKLNVTGTETGKALAIFNDTGTDQNIISASASGITVANLDRSGNLAIDGALSDLNDDSLQVTDNLIPSADNTYDLGSASNRWKDFYVVNLQASETNISGTTSETFTIDTDDSGGDLSFIFGQTLDERLTWDATTDNRFEFSDALEVQGDLTSTGNLDVDGTSNDIAGTLNLSGDILTSSGDLVIDPTGGGVKIGTGTPGDIDLAGDDLYITQDLEVDGTIYGNVSGTIDPNFTQGSIVFANASGELAQDNASLFFDDTDNLVGVGTNLPDAKLQVEGAVTGKALTIFNETGDQDILVASASGITRARITNGGNLYITGTLNTISGNLTIDSSGGQTSVNDNLVVTGTSDLQGNVSDSGGDLTFSDNIVVTGTSDLQGNISDSGGNLTLDDAVDVTGDLAVNGGDITTTQTTFNLINTTATTLNIGGAATSLSLGAGSGTTTVNNALTITGNLTANGDVDLGDAVTDSITFTGRADSDLLPISDNTYDLGSSSLQFAEIRGVAIYQNGNQVCDDSGNCTGGDAGPWNETTGVVHLDTTSNLVSIGDSTTEHKLEVEGAVTGKALVSLWEKGDQDILVASNSATPANVFRVTNTGSVHLTGTLNTTSGNLTIDSAGGQTQVSDNFVVTGTSDLQGNISDSGGNLTLDDAVDITGNLAVNGGTLTSSQTTFNLLNSTPTTINFGGAATTLSIGNSSGTTTVNNALTVTSTLTANGDVDLGNATGDTITYTGRVDSNIEPSVDSTYDLGTNTLRWANVYADNLIGTVSPGFTQGSIVFADANGDLAQDNASLFFDDTNDLVGIGTNNPTSKLHLTGAVTGKALAIFNEAGDQDILAASASGTTRARITNDGQFVLPATGSSGGLSIGGDTNLYRSGTNILTTDDTFNAVSALQTGGTFEALRNFSVPQRFLISSANDANVPVLYVDSNGQITMNAQGTQAIRLNFDKGTGGTVFGDGAGAQAAILNSSGQLGLRSDSPVGKLDVEGAITGKALTILNETGDQAIFTASQSGTPRFTIENSGDLTWNASTPTLTFTDGEIISFSDGTNDLVAINDQGAYPYFNLKGKSTTGDPASCSEGDIYYNAQDDTISICHSGNTWEQLDGGGGSSVWSDLLDPTTDLTLNHAEYETLFNWNTATDAALDGFTFNVTNDLGTDTSTQRAVVIENADDGGSTGTQDNLLVLDNLDTNEAVTKGLEILSSGGGGITTAVDVSDADIGTAVSAGANDLSGTNWSITGASGNFAASGVIDIDGTGTSDIAGTLRLSGNSLTSTGDLTINPAGGQVILSDTDTLNVGGKTGLAYNAFADGADAPDEGVISSDNDLYVGGALEVDGGFYADAITPDGFTQGSVVFAGSGGTLSQDNGSLFFDDSTNKFGVGNNSPVGKFDLEGAVTGKALSILNETGDQAILTASASGTTVMTLGRTGNLSLTNSGSNNIAFDLTSTGDFTISDAGTPFATFTDGGVFTLDSLNFDASTIGTTSDTDLLSLATDVLTVNGDVRLADTFTVEVGGKTGVAYNAFANSGESPTVGSIDADNDVFVGGDLQVGGTIYDSTGNPLSATFWTLSSSTLYPNQLDYNVGVGTQTAGDIISKLYVTNDGSLTGKALAIFNQTENEDILTASASGSTKLTLKNDGTLQLFNSSSSISNTSGDITIDAASGTISFAGDNISNIGTVTAGTGIFTSKLQVANSGTVAYSRFGSNTTGHSGNLTAGEDLLLSGDLELDSILYLDGGNIANSAGTSTITFTGTPTTGQNSLSASSWLIENTANVGLAALTVNQTKGGDILTASESGTTKLTLDNSGNLGIGVDPAALLHTQKDDASTNTEIELSRFGRSTSGTAATNIGGYNSIYIEDDAGNLVESARYGALARNVSTGDSFASEFSISVERETFADMIEVFSAYATGGNKWFCGNSSRDNGPDCFGWTIGSGNDASLQFDGTNIVNWSLKTSPNRFETQALSGYDLSFRTLGASNAIEFDQGNDGADLYIDGDGQIGINNSSPTTDLHIGTNAETHTLGTDDVLISSDLELDGVLYLDGGTISNSSGTGTVIFSSSPTTTENSLSASSWLVENTANVGKAALLVNQTKGGDLFTASQSGTTKFRIANNGNVTIDGSGTMLTVGGGTGKIDVGTVDPVYSIGGTKYATYMAGMIGVKEETTGKVETTQYEPGVGYKHTIDFTKQEKGSDLWLFSKASDLSKHIDDMVVLLSGAGNTKTWYEVDPERYTLSIYTSRPTSVSYRLTAPRFDAALWTNYNDNPESTGFQVSDEELTVNDNGEINEAEENYIANLKVEKSAEKQSGFFETSLPTFNLVDQQGNTIHEIGQASRFVAGNIKVGAAEVTNLAVKSGAYIAKTMKAGAVETKYLTTDSFLAFQGTVDSLLVKSGLVSPYIETEVISPIADSDVRVNLDNSKERDGSSFGKLVVEGEENEEVASIDSQGNATFSGTVESEEVKTKEINASRIYADEIIARDGKFGEISSATTSAVTLEDIENLLKQSEVDQKALSDSTNSNIYTATDSATLDEIATSSLYVTNQAAISSLSVTESMVIGADFSIQTSTNENGIANATSLNTLSAPLQIQSLALAPVEIMSGLFRIETNGDVAITGNLRVAGNIEAEGLTLRQNGESPETATSSGFLNLVDASGNQVAGINASGSARFSSLSTDKVVIAGSEATTSASLLNGLVTDTNATAGEGVIPEGVREITIRSPHVTDYTLVYVTPTSSTENNVLYVKSKSEGQFVVGFSSALDIDVSFNWWVIDVTQQNGDSN